MQKSVAERQFKGPVDCVRHIYCLQGLKGLWSGFSGSLIYRSNFFWMFLSFEVRSRYPCSNTPRFLRNSNLVFQGLMRSFTRLQGTQYEVNYIRNLLFHGGKKIELFFLLDEHGHREFFVGWVICFCVLDHGNPCG